MSGIENTNNILNTKISSSQNLSHKQNQEYGDVSVFYDENENTDGNYDSYNITDFEVENTNPNYFLETVKEIQSDIDTGKKTRNEEIGDYKQNLIQDCWFLSALTTLSSSEKGKQLIKNAINYTDKGIEITFKGLNKHYTISNKEIEKAKTVKGNFTDLKYTEGDDDVVAFELALEKLSGYIADNEIDIEGNVSDFEQTDIINGNSPEFAMEILGIDTQKCETNIQHPEELDRFLQNTTDEKLNENTASILCSNNAQTVKDINGNEKELKEMHTYGVKTISKEDNTVTFSDPWDTTEDIILSMDTIRELINYENISLRTFNLE